VVSVAEEVGLIGEVTRIVLRKVLAQIRAWKENGFMMKAAVNISAYDVSDENFFPMLEETLLRNGLTGKAIALEITERTVIENMAAARRFIQRARSIGVTMEIDDFGVAHSSLNEIASIDFDLLKIDKSFVDYIIGDTRNQKVVRFILQLARELGARTIAEGVETPEQAMWLKEAGCDLIQGYLYAKPMPPKDLEAWYSSRKG
jgi:EAL domain-containing protein (putative c-di-GMP-specific phosphodiesterase class I)